MGLYYAAAAIFLTVFYPRALTNLICYGRNGDQLYIKSRKIYYLIYTGWTILVAVLCLMMGAVAGVDSKFDRVLDYVCLEFHGEDYRQGDTIYENEYKPKESDFTHVYYVKRDEENVNELVERIVKENSFIYEAYSLEKMEVIFEKSGDGYGYSIKEGGETLAKVSVKNTGLLKKISYRWDRELLNKRSRDDYDWREKYR